jgi:WD40 repeat protein
VSSGEEIVNLPHEGFVSAVTFSPNGKYLATASDDGTARVWAVESGEEISHVVHEQSVASIAFSPNGKFIASGSWDYSIRVWEANTGRELARMMHEGLVTSVHFTPKGEYIVSSSTDDTARVWYWLMKDLVEEACMRLPRNLSLSEWNLYLGDAPYSATCGNIFPATLTPSPQP